VLCSQPHEPAHTRQAAEDIVRGEPKILEEPLAAQLELKARLERERILVDM